jgi:hypothetical protein
MTGAPASSRVSSRVSFQVGRFSMKERPAKASFA